MKTLDSSIYLKIFRALPVGVFLVDGEKHICEWNDWLVERTDISRINALSACVDELFPDINTARFEFAVEQVLLHQHPQVLSQILNRYLIPIPLSKASATEDVEYMQQAISIFPIVDKEMVYAMVVILDVTENYHQRHMLLHVAKRFEEESVRDELTGLYNRRFLWEYLESELPKASRENYSVVCTVYDLDYFKAVNDDLGHKRGDEVLVSFVNVLKQSMRAGDRAFRYGGEEFITISSHVDVKKAGVLAERICKKMAAQKQHGSVKRVITCSAGFAVAKPLYIPFKGESLVKHADEALYQAKETGRNRVCAYTEGVDDSAEVDEMALLDFSYVKKIVHGDEALQIKLYTVFLEESFEQEPVLKEAFLSEDAKYLVAGMHLLKSSAKAVGALPLAICAESLELAARAADMQKVKQLEAGFFEVHQQTMEAVSAYLADENTSTAD